MRGLSLPSWLVACCAAVVALALVGFVVTGERDSDVSAAPRPPTRPRRPTASRTAAATAARRRQGATARSDGQGRRPRPSRSSGAPPTSRSTTTPASPAWPATPPRCCRTAAGAWWPPTTGTARSRPTPSTTRSSSKAQARLLARDLGVSRLHPAVAPMSFDRITVILTARTLTPCPYGRLTPVTLRHGAHDRRRAGRRWRRCSTIPSTRACWPSTSTACWRRSWTTPTWRTSTPTRCRCSPGWRHGSAPSRS